MKIAVWIVGLSVLLAATGAAAQTPPRSSLCSVHEQNAPAGGIAPTTTIRMNNDGNPCWYIRKAIVGARVVSAPMHVTKQPRFGTVDITVLDNGTRVSYKPNAGFSGTDEFSVINEMYNVDRPYKVTVTK